MIGANVGTYRITGAIGRGGMGAVYLAEHTLLGRPAAVKVLLPEYSRDQDMVTRFFNEAKAATAIRHPGIVEIYDFGWNSDGTAYIVMEHLQGESLAARLERGRLPQAQCVALLRQIAGALAAAHRKGIVHRDLKPDNVFLVPDPEVPGGERIKLLDFGIAKLATHHSPGQKTRTGAVVGTPTYMAPEQCRGVAVDHRADLYALGCMLFELMSGRPPFMGEGVGDVLAAHIHVPPPPLPSAPESVGRLVDRLLVKEPSLRIQHADEVIHAIDAMAGSLPGVGGAHAGISQPPFIAMPTTLSGASASVRTTHAGHGPHLGRWLVVAGVIVVLAGVGALLAGRDEPAVAAAIVTVTDAGIDAPPPVDASIDIAIDAPPPIDAAIDAPKPKRRDEPRPRPPPPKRVDRDEVVNPF